MESASSDFNWFIYVKYLCRTGTTPAKLPAVVSWFIMNFEHSLNPSPASADAPPDLADSRGCFFPDNASLPSRTQIKKKSVKNSFLYRQKEMLTYFLAEWRGLWGILKASTARRDVRGAAGAEQPGRAMQELSPLKNSCSKQGGKQKTSEIPQ